MLWLIEGSKEMSRIFLAEPAFVYCIQVKAAGPVINKPRRRVGILKTSLEITYPPADQPPQTNISIVIPRIQPIEIKPAKSFDIPFLVARFIPVFSMCKNILGIYPVICLRCLAGQRRIKPSFQQFQCSPQFNKLLRILGIGKLINRKIIGGHCPSMSQVNNVS